jgi:poly(A) polymerase
MTIQVYKQNEHSIARDKIDSEAIWVIQMLTNSGFTARLVGGGVRDLLLDKEPKDFDIVTNATPNQVKKIFRYSRIIGRRFKLVQVWFKSGNIIEVSTFREQEKFTTVVENLNENGLIKSDNTYGDEVSDALRRDLTINALFFDPERCEVIDYVGGMNDLKNKTVKVIGDPALRFAQDPVRMIRVIRHAARADFSIDELTWEVLKTSTDLILQCPSNRVYDEFFKDLHSGSTVNILKLMESSGIIYHIVPSFKQIFLHEESPIYSSLLKWDKIIRSGNKLSPALFFSLIFLFNSTKEPHIIKRDLEELVSDNLEDEESNRYSVLSSEKGCIPRKIKEDVQLLLGLWLKILNNELHDISKYENKLIPLVIDLHNLLPEGRDDAVIFRRIRSICNNKLVYLNNIV